MPKRFQSLRDRFERLAFAGLKTDESPLPGPMTLRRRIVIGVAALAAVGVVIALVIVLQKPSGKIETAAANAPPLQIVKPGVIVEKNRYLSVEEMDFNKVSEPKEITGILRNLTNKHYDSCDVSFDVTTKTGGQLGAVATTVHDLAPHGTAQFRIVVRQKEAAFAMVRELRPE